MSDSFGDGEESVDVFNVREDEFGHFPAVDTRFGDEAEDFGLAVVNVADESVEMFFKISHISAMRSPDDGWSEFADSRQ